MARVRKEATDAETAQIVEDKKSDVEVKGSKLKVGSIELEINPAAPTEYTPKDSKIIDSAHELEMIARGIKDNLPVLIIGETGSGKTSFIRYLAHQTNNSFRRMNLNGQTTTDELVGHYTVDDKEKGMRWIKGVLYEAMEQGHWLLLDELNAGLPEVLFALQSVLDDDHFLIAYEHEKEVIRPHANFRLFATMNPSLEYAGTKDLNKALLSRFPIVMKTTYPDAKREIKIVQAHVPELDEKDIHLMVRVAEDIRKGKKNNSISFICSTRELINWAKLSVSMGVKAAAEVAILNKCELDTDMQTVEGILKMQFGKWDKKQIMTLDEIEKNYEKMVTDMKLVVEERDRLRSDLNAVRNGKPISADSYADEDERVIRELIQRAKGGYTGAAVGGSGGMYGASGTPAYPQVNPNDLTF